MTFQFRSPDTSDLDRWEISLRRDSCGGLKGSSGGLSSLLLTDERLPDSDTFFSRAGWRKGRSGGLLSSMVLTDERLPDSDTLGSLRGGRGGGCPTGEEASSTSSLTSSVLVALARLEMSAGWLRLSSDVSGGSCCLATGISYRALMSSSSSSLLSSFLVLWTKKKNFLVISRTFSRVGLGKRSEVFSSDGVVVISLSYKSSGLYLHSHIPYIVIAVNYKQNGVGDL